MPAQPRKHKQTDGAPKPPTTPSFNIIRPYVWCYISLLRDRRKREREKLYCTNLTDVHFTTLFCFSQQAGISLPADLYN